VNIPAAYEFVDPNCKEPVYVVRKTLGLDKGLAIPLEDPLVCEGAHHYAVKVFEPFNRTSYWMDGSNCVATKDSLLPPNEIRVIPNGERPASDWVQGEVSMRKGSGRVRLKEIHSADGGRFSHELYDQELGARCEAVPKGGGDPNLVCLPPQGMYGGSYFADSVCNTASLGMSFGTCERPAVIEMFAGGYRSVGKAWTANVYSSDGFTCKPENTQSNFFKYFELGAPLGNDPFAILEPKQIGAGPVTFTFSALDGEAAMATRRDSDEAFDSRLGTTCRLVNTPKNGIRCLPTEGFYNVDKTLFEDPVCTVALMPCEACEGKEVALKLSDNLERFPLVDIRRIGAEASGIYYELSDVRGKQVCKGPLDVRDWRGPKQEPISLPHLWRIDAATSWERFGEAFVRKDLGD